MQWSIPPGMQTTEYDIVVIGAGLGGLITACLLAKEGLKVCVLEKNVQAGGCMQNFALQQKRFESAVHYIGSLDKGQTLHRVFSYLGILDALSLQRLDESCFDEIILHDRSYAMAQGHEAFLEKMSDAFPRHRADVSRYIDTVKDVCVKFPLYGLELGDGSGKQAVSGFALKESLEAISGNTLLHQVLTGNNMLYGGSYEHTPFYLHALIENSYIESSWKCSKGSSQLTKLLQRTIQQHGGSIQRHAEVTFLAEKDGQVSYAVTNSGERFYARHFISNLHPAATYALLDQKLVRPATVKRIQSLEQTPSAFMVNLVLKPHAISYTNHNLYYHNAGDVWHDLKPGAGPLPTSFGIFSSEDPLHPGYAGTISILTYMQASEWDEWKMTHRTIPKRGERDAAYRERKLKHSEYIIEQVNSLLPGLKQAIQASDACTPLTYRDYLNYPDGGMYGIRKDVNHLAASTLSTRTKIPNLFLTGQNINMHGVLGVTITALLTASEFTGLEYLVHKIKSVSG